MLSNFTRPRISGLAALCYKLLVLAANPQLSLADTNTPPSIIIQPTNGVAGLGEDIVFTVQATGTTPLSYQWYFNGASLTGQTNSSLLLTNLSLASAGTFAVRVANSVGSLASSNALLTMQTNFWRRVETGRLLQIGAQVGVPIILRANGRENSLAFSLSFDTNVYSSPVFWPASSNTVVTSNLTQPGSIGITLALPPGVTYPAGYPWLGLLQLKLATGYAPLQGGLNFAADPVALAAANSSAQPLMITNSMQPQFLLVTSNAQLRAQSGLFEAQLLVGNPSPAIMTNVNILALNPGYDSLSNQITFFNAQNVLTNWPMGDPILDTSGNYAYGLNLDAGTNVVYNFTNYLTSGLANNGFDDTITNVPLSYAQINSLLPGESRLVTLEFYVPDHTSIPQPQYLLALGDPLTITTPAGAIPWAVTSSRYFNGNFVVDFATQLGYHYYIQYAATPGDLATNATMVLPPLTGTGSDLQWVDNGPPKTISPPVNGARFYQVLQTR